MQRVSSLSAQAQKLQRELICSKLPGKLQGQRCHVGYSPWCPRELDMPERLSQTHMWGLSSPTRDLTQIPCTVGLPCGSDGKESACNEGDLGSIPGWGRSSGGGHGSPLQHSCLENLMDRGVWWATVHGVTKSRTQLSDCAHSPCSLR